MLSYFNNLSSLVPFPWVSPDLVLDAHMVTTLLVLVVARCVQTSAPWHRGGTFAGSLLWQIGSPARQGVGGISLVALAQSV